MIIWDATVHVAPELLYQATHDLAADEQYTTFRALQSSGTRQPLAALSDAVRAYPKPLKWLLAEHPKPARPDPFGVMVGGDYESWLYREEALELWRKAGALDWARASAPALKLRR